MIPTSSIHAAPATSAATSEEMTPNKKNFVDKANQTVLRVVNEVLLTVVQSSSVKWPEFVAKQITPRQKALTEMDERTGKFFMKMMTAINPAINSVPTLTMSFQLFAMVSQDQHIGKKLVEGIALPHIKAMITELDAINPSIVDDIAAS